MTTGLAKREKFHVTALGTVESVIGPVDPILGRSSGAVCAQFRCIACDLILEWRDSWRLFSCRDCGFELTAAEAVEVCDIHIREIGKLADLAGRKRGWLWRLVHWFGGHKKSQ